MAPSRVLLVILTNVSTIMRSSGFLCIPSEVSGEKTTQLRRPARDSASSPWAGVRRHRTPFVTTRRRGCTREVPFPVLNVGAGIVDDSDPLEERLNIDPLDAGPDVVGPLYEDGAEGEEEKGEEGVYDGNTITAAAPIKKRSKGKVTAAILEEDDADAVSMAALAAAAKDTADKLQKKKKARKRSNPFMPKGAPGPLDWREFATLKEGVRGHLVVFHTGLPKDQAVADSLIRQVKDRFGDVVHVHEEFDDDENTTEEERRESNAFEVWLEGPEVIVYHARGEYNVDLTEEHIGKILDDLETRVEDESILRIQCTKAPPFMTPGLTPQELRSKAFYPL